MRYRTCGNPRVRHDVKTLLTFSLAAAGIAAGAPVFAQVASKPAEGTGNRPLEEVVVTVRRVTESLQDVPIAVNVMNAEQIADLRIKDISDALQFTPGAYFDGGSPDQTTISIRGISSDQYGASGDAGVLMMVDNAVISRSWMRSTKMFDINHIEVARGPQGTSFGRNTTGGVVHFLTNRPVFENETRINAEYGNYDLFELTGVLNRPITDNNAGRLSVYYNRRDGYFTDEIDGDPYDDTENWGARAQLLSEFGDRLSVLFRADYLDEHIDSTATQEVGGPGAPTDGPTLLYGPLFGGPDGCGAPCSFQPLDDDPYRIQNTRAINDYDFLGRNGMFFDRVMWSAGAEVVYELDGATITSMTNYRDGRVETRRELWGTPMVWAVQDSIEDATIAQQELRIDNSVADERLTWLFGLYYLHEDTLRFERKNLWFDTPGQTFHEFEQLNKTDSYGAFADFGFDVTDTTVVDVGARYTDDSKDYTVPFNTCNNDAPQVDWPDTTIDLSRATGGGLCNAFVGHDPVTGLSFASGHNDASWDEVTYRGSITQTIGDVNVYVSYARGYKSGGFANEITDSSPEALAPYAPEYVNATELGAKAALLADTLRVDVVLFNSDYKDMQVEDVTPQAQNITVNKGSANIRGVEAQFDWALTDRVRLMGNYSRMDHEDNHTGEPLPGVRDWSGYFAAAYTYPLASGSSVRLFADWRSTGEWVTSSDEILSTPDYLSANVSWASADGRLNLTLWGRNLTEKTMPATLSGFAFRSRGSWMPGPPRTFGVAARYRFD